jgi:outer membrane immunogenic protein
MMKKLLVASILLCFSGFSQANAEQTSSLDWSGFYMGGAVGGQMGSSSNGEYCSGSPCGTAGTFSGWTWESSTASPMIDIYAGANLAADGNFRLGIEGDVSYSKFANQNILQKSGIDHPEYINGWDGGLQGSLRLRAGVVVQDNALLYITGGLAAGHFDFDVFNKNSTTVFDRSTQDLLGWTAGAGGEFKLDQNWSVRGEYRYTKFSDFTFSNPLATGYAGYDLRYNTSQNVFMLGLTRQF